MSKKIAIINQKGGVGKSTTAEALAAGLSLKGFSVLAIDLDAQGNMTYTIGADPDGSTPITATLSLLATLLLGPMPLLLILERNID